LFGHNNFNEFHLPFQVSNDFTDRYLDTFANLWIYELGSELKIRQEDSDVIFEFALPIVEE